jgi:hypothetical protein
MSLKATFDRIVGAVGRALHIGGAVDKTDTTQPMSEVPQQPQSSQLPNEIVMGYDPRIILEETQNVIQRDKTNYIEPLCVGLGLKTPALQFLGIVSPHACNRGNFEVCMNGSRIYAGLVDETIESALQAERAVVRAAADVLVPSIRQVKLPRDRFLTEKMLISMKKMFIEDWSRDIEERARQRGVRL